MVYFSNDSRDQETTPKSQSLLLHVTSIDPWPLTVVETPSPHIDFNSQNGQAIAEKKGGTEPCISEGCPGSETTLGISQQTNIFKAGFLGNSLSSVSSFFPYSAVVIAKVSHLLHIYYI